MAKNRRTARDRREERDRQERDEWYRFRDQLQKAKTGADVETILTRCPRETEPGRSFYSNLAFYWEKHIVPLGSSFEEKDLYLRLFERLVANGELSEPEWQKPIDELKKAMYQQSSGQCNFEFSE